MSENVSHSIVRLIRPQVPALLSMIVFVATNVFLAVTSSGFDEFKEAMEKRYRLKSVSCKACHTDNKDKKFRNAFGKLLHAELKEKKITNRFKEAKSQGEDAEEKFKKQMVKDFLAALREVEKKPVTFLSLAEVGLLNGTRLDKNQVDVDSLTVKTLTAEDLAKPPKNGSNIIHGEIKQMEPDEDRPKKKETPSKTNQPAKSTKPADSSGPEQSQPKTDDASTPAEKPKSATNGESK